MSVIIKSFMGIFFFALVVFAGMGMINYQMEVGQAAGYKRDLVQEIQNSNFSPSVMNACIAAGTALDYEVTIDISDENGTHHSYDRNHLASDTLEAAAAYVTVKYKSRMPFLGLETSNSLRGFAR